MKKMLATVLAGVITACGIISAGAVPAPDMSVPYGDVNGDFTVDVKDATDIQKSLAQIITLDGINSMLADFNRDGIITVDDATYVQKSIAGIALPENVGGRLYMTVNFLDFTADQSQANVGETVTFTANACDERLAYDVMYEFAIDGMVVQKKSSNASFSHAFEASGDYIVKAKAYNRSGYYVTRTIRYSVGEIALENPKAKLQLSNVKNGFKSVIIAEDGKAPYTYCLTIKFGEDFGDPYFSYDEDLFMLQLEAFKAYAAENETEWEIRYSETGAPYLYREFSKQAESFIPEAMLTEEGLGYSIYAQVKDADGKLLEAERCIIPMGYVL